MTTSGEASLTGKANGRSAIATMPKPKPKAPCVNPASARAIIHHQISSLLSLSYPTDLMQHNRKRKRSCSPLLFWERGEG